MLLCIIYCNCATQWQQTYTSLRRPHQLTHWASNWCLYAQKTVRCIIYWNCRRQINMSSISSRSLRSGISRTQQEAADPDARSLTWNRSYMWPGPSCDRGTPCPPPTAPHQSVTSVHKRTSAAPAGRQRSPRWPTCAHRDLTWLCPMNCAPVLKSPTAGRTGQKPTRKKTRYIPEKKEEQTERRGVELLNTSTGWSGGVLPLGGKTLRLLLLMRWRTKWQRFEVVDDSVVLRSCSKAPETRGRGRHPHL